MGGIRGKENKKKIIKAIIKMFFCALVFIFTSVLKSTLRMQYLCEQSCVKNFDIYNNSVYADIISYTQVDVDKLSLCDYMWICVNSNYKNVNKDVDNYITEKLLNITGNTSFVDKFILGFYAKNNIKELYNACGKYIEIKNEMRFFPVVTFENDDHEIVYSDSWNAARTYGGNREHKGCDIIDVDNVCGYFPVVSVCDGVVEKCGWLELGGCRIGIRSENGIYYYYAHLNSYAPGIKEGNSVKGGQIIGFMGNTGYGKEGTKDKFNCHLHFGIYVDDKCECAINPYYFLDELYDERLVYVK